MDSEEILERIPARTKILAYLGQLKTDEWASGKEICIDLDIRSSSAKNILNYMFECGLVKKKITLVHCKIAYFQLPEKTIPPEWSDAYGRHPHSS